MSNAVSLRGKDQAEMRMMLLELLKDAGAYRKRVFIKSVLDQFEVKGYMSPSQLSTISKMYYDMKQAG